MASKRRPKATVHNIADARARRGRLPWVFTVDLAANHFHAGLYRDARPFDLLAMADAADEWAKALRQAARALRRGYKKCAR